MATTQTIPEFFGKHPMFFGKQALIFRKQTLFSRMQKSVCETAHSNLGNVLPVFDVLFCK